MFGDENTAKLKLRMLYKFCEYKNQLLLWDCDLEKVVVARANSIELETQTAGLDGKKQFR